MKRMAATVVGSWMILAVSVLCSLAAVRAEETSAGAAGGELTKILLIGDSISSGYSPVVTEAFAGHAQVLRRGAGRGTSHSLARIDSWLLKEEWDIIHFNWGLWDCRHKINKDGTAVPDGERGAVSIDQYEKNLRKLVSRLEATGAKLVWANTTPVLWDKPGLGRTDPDVQRYNEVACRIMRTRGIAVNDLHAVVKPRLDELQAKAYASDVHYTQEGYKVIGQAVVRAIQTAMSRVNKAEGPEAEGAKAGAVQTEDAQAVGAQASNAKESAKPKARDEDGLGFTGIMGLIVIGLAIVTTVVLTLARRRSTNP